MNRILNTTQRATRSSEIRRTGFTLIEMMAVLVLVGMLLAITVPAFINMGRGTKFDTAIAQLRATIGQSRQWAIAHRETTYVVFPNDFTSFSGRGTEFVNTYLRGYNVWTASDGYIRDWSFLPPGLLFVRNNGDHSKVSNATSVLDDGNSDNKFQLEFPESGDPLRDLAHIGFKPDGTTVHDSSNKDREIFIGEGQVGVDESTGNIQFVQYMHETNAPLFGVRVSMVTGSARVRDYQDQ